MTDGAAATSGTAALTAAGGCRARRWARMRAEERAGRLIGKAYLATRLRGRIPHRRELRLQLLQAFLQRRYGAGQGLGRL